jgi:hypothetical protein
MPTEEPPNTMVEAESLKSYKTSLPPSPDSSDHTNLPGYAISAQSIQIHGRKYQSFSSKYILPNDEEESDRLVQVVCI